MGLMTTGAKVGLGIVGLVMGVSLLGSEPTSKSQNTGDYLPQVQQVEQSPSCHPSYSGCLRQDASDYDCAGGSGNGPYYTGRVKILGPDVFGLDRDGDGWGCE